MALKTRKLPVYPLMTPLDAESTGKCSCGEASVQQVKVGWRKREVCRNKPCVRQALNSLKYLERFDHAREQSWSRQIITPRLRVQA